MGSIDEEKKKLYDSIDSIATENALMIAAQVLQLMYHRREHCRKGIATQASKEDISGWVKSYNEQIKKLLSL